MRNHRRNRHPQLSSPTDNPFPPPHNRLPPGPTSTPASPLITARPQRVYRVPPFSAFDHLPLVHRSRPLNLDNAHLVFRSPGLHHREPWLQVRPPVYHQLAPRRPQRPGSDRGAHPRTFPSTEHDDSRSRSASSGPSTTGAASWRTSPSTPPPEFPAASSRFNSYDPTPPPPYRRFRHRDTTAYDLGPPSPSVSSSSSEEITDDAPARPPLTVSRRRRRSATSPSPYPYTFTPVPFCLDRRARYLGRSARAGSVGPEDPDLAVGTLRHLQFRCRE
ncbi:hypothetical protein CDEST_00164 [Colletotrichum destructivum]|uniref:Uncharacterized protein n=1 Tax=Colletotrichum destructivum TaxID=34406 RepID=A0AAX4HWB8_9PEZI|nr:hypothetical protein CDEST_00164 [Colletotrichum destructivum]